MKLPQTIVSFLNRLTPFNFGLATKPSKEASYPLPFQMDAAHAKTYIAAGRETDHREAQCGLCQHGFYGDDINGYDIMQYCNFHGQNLRVIVPRARLNKDTGLTLANFATPPQLWYVKVGTDKGRVRWKNQYPTCQSIAPNGRPYPHLAPTETKSPTL